MRLSCYNPPIKTLEDTMIEDVLNFLLTTTDERIEQIDQP